MEKEQINRLESLTEKYKREVERVSNTYRSETDKRTREEIRKLEDEAVALGVTYRPESESRFNPNTFSHFDDVAYNMIAVLSLVTDAMKNGKNFSWEKGMEMYLEHADLLDYYLSLIKANPEIRKAEMKTQKGYLEQKDSLNGITGYSASKFIGKLKEFMESATRLRLNDEIERSKVREFGGLAGV